MIINSADLDRYFLTRRCTDSCRPRYPYHNGRLHASPFQAENSWNGKPFDKDPLKDIRVRQAISKAIYRQALVERTLERLAVSAFNIVAPGILGYVDTLEFKEYDTEDAKKLLAAAEYPNSFVITLHDPKNLYINDERVVQILAQFLNQVEIQVKVETLALTVYFGKARAGQYSAALLGSCALLGIVVLVHFLAVLFLELFVVHVADRYDRRKISRICLFIRGLAAAALAIGSYNDWMNKEAIFAIVFPIDTTRALESAHTAGAGTRTGAPTLGGFIYVLGGPARSTPAVASCSLLLACW